MFYMLFYLFIFVKLIFLYNCFCFFFFFLAARKVLVCRMWNLVLWPRLNLLLFSLSVVSDSLWPCGLQHAGLPRPSPSTGACSNTCPFSQWCHPTILPSATPFSCPQSFPASGSFLMGQLFSAGGPSFGASASASIVPMNIQDWSPLGWTGWISLQPRGLSRVFSNTTVRKHQFFSAQLSL